MVPAAFVLLEALPLTPNGKIDRKALPAPELGASDKSYVAPCTPTQEVLAGIWSQVLHIERVGVHDNFFELGGHSLLAVQIASRVQRELGVQLPLATLFHHPTLQELAAEVSARKKALQCCLVPLVSQGDGHPLYLVHPAGGNVMCYADLARALCNGQPIYGLQAIGIDGNESPLRSVEAMAERYLLELRDAQPQGPYFLAGWSFGGLVAYEMAHRLRCAGEAVALLALLDASASPRGTYPVDDFGVITALCEDMATFDFTPLRAMQRTDALQVVLSHMQKNGLLPDANLESVQPLLDVAKANIAAQRAYRPPRYDGEVTLFVATEGENLEIANKTLGWSDAINGKIVVHRLAAPHGTMVIQPHAEPLADLLRAAIAQGRRIEAPRQETAAL
jgi:thioesterase domain-containing protein/acyl carrier protein